MRVAAMSIVALGTALGGCGEAFSSRVDVVAEVGPYELSVDRLAEIIAAGKGLPLRRDVAEGIAYLWVDYTIFADRIASGDSLTDSGYVAAAMWPEFQQELADRYHEMLVADAVQLDSAQLDSVYAAGEYRYIQHVLFSVGPNATPEVRQAQRRLAEDTYRRIERGDLTWAEAARSSDDPGTQGTDGALGVIGRGETVPPFESVAFALAPGQMSPVTETSYGYHILTRPPLAAIREEFRTGLAQRREDAFDDAFLAQLPSRWDIEVRQGIGPAIREMGHDPVRAKASGKVLGTYRGERFRVSDFARWVQAMPMSVRQQLQSASDSQVTGLVSSLMRNEALLREARDSGAVITEEFHLEMVDQLRRRMSLVASLLGFPPDTLPVLRGLSPEAVHAAVAERVLGYLQAVSQNETRLQPVPPFLADTLRAEADWRVSPAGIERVLERARQLRLSGDPLSPPAAAPADTAATSPPPTPDAN